jgi:hypothetical protein
MKTIFKPTYSAREIELIACGLEHLKKAQVRALDLGELIDQDAMRRAHEETQCLASEVAAMRSM